MKPLFAVELLADQDRADFSSGADALDGYFKTQVTEDIRRQVTNCFVAVEIATEIVAGFYTLSAASIPTPALPHAINEQLPRYPTVPVIRVARLAVDVRFGESGLGGALLAHAAARGVAAEVAAFAMLVDAKDEAAVAFYQHHGFEKLASHPQTLFLALATAKAAFATRAVRKR